MAEQHRVPWIAELLVPERRRYLLLAAAETMFTDACGLFVVAMVMKKDYAQFSALVLFRQVGDPPGPHCKAKRYLSAAANASLKVQTVRGGRPSFGDAIA